MKIFETKVAVHGDTRRAVIEALRSLEKELQSATNEELKNINLSGDRWVLSSRTVRRGHASDSDHY